MIEAKEDDGNPTYPAREAVGVFDDAEALEAAVDELEISGFDRAAISVLASNATVGDRLGKLYATVACSRDRRSASGQPYPFLERDPVAP